jgi:hypothetical protein
MTRYGICAVAAAGQSPASARPRRYRQRLILFTDSEAGDASQFSEIFAQADRFSCQGDRGRLPDVRDRIPAPNTSAIEPRNATARWLLLGATRPKSPWAGGA